MTAYSSISEKKRVPILDFLRGIALLGILIVNANDYRFSVPNTAPNFNMSNAWFNNLIIAAGEGSFYPMFSILFGIGFAIWMDKSMKQNGSVLRFGWRAFILFLLGCLFFCFVEDRDILIRYAILSIPLLLFYKARPRTVFVWATLFFIMAFFFTYIFKEINSLTNAQVSPQQKMEAQRSIDAWHAAENNKDYFSYVKARYVAMPKVIKDTYTFRNNTLPLIFSMFLLGVFCWRKKLFTEVENYGNLWKRVFWMGLLIGVSGNLFIFIIRILATNHLYTPNPTVVTSIETIADPFLTFFYISLCVFLFQKANINKQFLIRALCATGKMPLTNYFLQYSITTILMTPYGFNLDRKLYSQHLIFMSLVIFIFQVLFSVVWTKWFVYGPMEWLWRSLTYFKIQRMKKVDTMTYYPTSVTT